MTDKLITRMGEINAFKDPSAANLYLAQGVREISRLRARVDALMLEHCPKEMSEEQLKEWADSQRDSDEPPAALHCTDCRLLYSDPGWADFVIADDVWQRIAPEGGVLCATCMFRRMLAAGIDNAEGRFTSGPCAQHDWKKPAAELALARVHSVCQFLRDEIGPIVGVEMNCEKCPAMETTPSGQGTKMCVIRANDLLAVLGPAGDAVLSMVTKERDEYAALITKGKGEHGQRNYVRDETWAQWQGSLIALNYIIHKCTATTGTVPLCPSQADSDQ